MKYSNVGFIDTTYMRVIPRDFFNEAKLLNSIGRLTLLMHDGLAPDGLQFEENEEGAGFEIGLCDDGHLMINNITFRVNETALYFKTPYNSKSKFPLLVEYNYTEYCVFDDNGNFDKEFIELCENIKS